MTTGLPLAHITPSNNYAYELTKEKMSRALVVETLMGPKIYCSFVAHSIRSLWTIPIRPSILLLKYR